MARSDPRFISDGAPPAPKPVEIAPTVGADFYICGVFETVVVLGRISPRNRDRAEIAMQQNEGPEGEKLEAFASGSREELMRIYPELLGDWSFAEADQAHRQNPKQQVIFGRAD